MNPLTRLANKLGAQKGQVYPGVTGELKIASELPYCQSCTEVIKQFNEIFPNLKIILINGAK
ncbi:MAG TPA: hypothetical protein VK518_15135 [Puia sp.]|nr:hypothetical protein [Puia sp.]